jgi:hypothetical protein
MHYEQIRRAVATKRSMKQIETSLHSKLNNVRIDEISDEQLMGRSGSKLLYRLFGVYVWPGRCGSLFPTTRAMIREE